MPATATLEKALSALPGGYLLLDEARKVCFATARFYQLLHCAPLQYGQPLPASLLPEELRPALQAGQAHASQQVYAGQLLDWLLTPLPDGTMLSIREDRQTFRNLIENSPDIISRYDPQLVCLYANSALARYSPIPPALHVGLGIEERGLPAHVCDAFRHASSQVLASGKPVTFENQLNHHDRHYVFESRLFPETDEHGQVQSLLCIDRDISEEHAMRLWQADENRLLEMIANDRPMKEVMVWTCHMIESQIEGSMCSIMLLDDEGIHLRVAAGPSLPDEYKAQVDGITIGASVGSCGTAAFTGEGRDRDGYPAAPVLGRVCRTSQPAQAAHLLVLPYQVARWPRAGHLCHLFCPPLRARQAQRVHHPAHLAPDGHSHPAGAPRQPAVPARHARLANRAL